MTLASHSSPVGAPRPRGSAEPGLRCLVAAGLSALLAGAPAPAQAATPAVACESLAQLSLPDTTVTLAQPVAAGQFKMPSGSRRPPQSPEGAQTQTPAFCRVAATLKPSRDSDIKMEVWLPLEGWNGKFLGVGNGGWAGRISYTGNPLGLIDAVQRGYAAANTDTGHDASETPGGTFIPGHPEKLIDYGHRAVHEMTVKAKAIVAAYYGVPAKYSYFIGCSLGGMQAVVEASRFPDDYDGIVAGAPANPMTLFNSAQIWPAWLISKDPSRFIPDSKYTMIHEAALRACATPVGANDGLIEEPDRCPFDPRELLCKGADGPDCLTASQVDLMRQIYAGPVNPRTKEPLFPGPAVGGELQLPAFAGTKPHSNSVNLYTYAVHQDPDWDWRTMDFDTDIALANKVVDPQMRADSHLKPFADRGGKLLIYIGWTDYHNPREVVAYYNAALEDVGAEKGRSSIRLFIVPGMDHCGGGKGCDTFEKLVPVEHWVEDGKAPEEILSSKLRGGEAMRTRPLCAYPRVAKYRGTGSIDEAGNFVCPSVIPLTPE
jgi:feruloyl esterase